MPTSIHPCLATDLPTKVSLELETFRHHPRIPIQWPLGYTADLLAWKNFEDREAFDDPGNHFWKAVEAGTGEVVGTAEWTLRLDRGGSGGMKAEVEVEGEGENGDGDDKKEGDGDVEEPPANWPEGGNWALKQFWKRNFKRMESEYLGGRDYIILNFLCILPQFQHRGIGSQLLAWGTHEADKRQIPMCLESTPAGLPVYEKAGFRVVEVVNKDMREFGWREPYDEQAALRIFMVREPVREGC